MGSFLSLIFKRSVLPSYSKSVRFDLILMVVAYSVGVMREWAGSVF